MQLDLGGTFEKMGNLKDLTEFATVLIQCGYESYNDKEITEKEACLMIDSLGGVTGEKLSGLLQFAIGQYVNTESTKPAKKK
jgi:hypothetical protein